MSRPDPAPTVGPAVAPLPARDSESLFAEAWEAEVLGLAYSLIEAGRIANADWSQALGAARKRQEESGLVDTREAYYLAAVEALEQVVQQAGLAGAAELAGRKADWVEAYHRTPHGQPVHLARIDGPDDSN